MLAPQHPAAVCGSLRLVLPHVKVSSNIPEQVKLFVSGLVGGESELCVKQQFH